MLEAHRSCARVIGFVALAGALLVPSGANAAEPDEASRPWYGWQIALVDAAGVGAFVVMQEAVQNRDLNAARSAAAPWLAAGLALYVLGGATVHSAHGNGRGAARSLLLRIILPLGGGLLLGLGQHGVGAAASGLSGLALGGIAAMTIDWTLARAPEPAAALLATPVMGQGRTGLALRLRF